MGTLLTENMRSIAEEVYLVRSKAGLSQAELAKRAGVSRHTVINIESAEAPGLSLAAISKVLDALGLTLSIRRQVLPANPKPETTERAGKGDYRGIFA